MAPQRSLMIVLAVTLAISTFAANTDVRAYKTAAHSTLVDLSMQTLEDDGYTYLVDYLVSSEILKTIRQGVTDSDRLDLAVNHYYDPVTKQGLPGAAPGPVIAQTFFSQAISSYAAGDVTTAWYYFGWSLHVVQDLMVPFHSNLDPLNGHSEYERYAYDQRLRLPLPANGTYSFAANASLWAELAASISYPYYDDVSGNNATNTNFDAVLTILYPKTIGLTAGYIKFFADAIGIGDFNLWRVGRGLDYVTIGWDESLDEDFRAYEVYVSLEKDDVYDYLPRSIITARDVTKKTIAGLSLGVDYYVRVKAVSENSTCQSNLLKVSPHWPGVFFIVPAMTTLVALVILISKSHRTKRRVRK